jgi:hypothetical protein
MGVVSFTTRGKRPKYPLDRRLGGPEERKSLPVPEIELYRLSYRGFFSCNKPVVVGFISKEV